MRPGSPQLSHVSSCTRYGNVTFKLMGVLPYTSGRGTACTKVNGQLNPDFVVCQRALHPCTSERGCIHEQVNERCTLHKSMGIASLYKAIGAISLHKSMGTASLHKSMGAASLHKSMGVAFLHKSMGAAYLPKSMGTASLNKSMRAPMGAASAKSERLGVPTCGCVRRSTMTSLTRRQWTRTNV